MKIKRVLILIDLNLDLKVSETSNYLSSTDWKMEKKIVNALRRRGYQVACVAVKGNIYQLIQEIKSFHPDILFNLSEALWMDRKYEPYFLSFIESFNLPITGAPSDLLLRCKNKAITKSILENLGVDVGRFCVLSDNQWSNFKELSYPMIVKPLESEASEGISRNSVVKNDFELKSRIEFIRKQNKNTNLPVLVEEFIAGPEIYVSLMKHGNSFKIFEPRILSFGKIKNPLEKLATYFAKWNDEFREKWKIQSKPAKNYLSPIIYNKLIDKTLKIANSLSISGYARIDFRLDEVNSKVICLEVNPNPSIYPDDEFALSARNSGVKFPDLLSMILIEAKESFQQRSKNKKVA